jgi:hypothetical protein
MGQATNGDHQPDTRERADHTRESTGGGAAAGDVEGAGPAGHPGDWTRGGAAGGDGDAAESDGPWSNGAGSDGAGTDAGVDVQERARQGVEHLQAAARELIAAARAALDVAEEVVNDPDAVASLAGLVAGLGDLARRVAGGGWPPPTERAPGPPEGERPAKVERIRVT